MGYTRTVLEEGSGPNPVFNQTAVMHYTGWLKDTSQPENKGKKFDSSYDRNEPLEFKINGKQVIEGWDQGVREMRVGEKARLDITSESAYKDRGAGNVIPPNADLIFDVHLVEIK
ncbi:peptidyl-prolyl cis-trans isomerase [Trichoderma austrokoningii]